jgi:hypothetical protein
MSRADVNEKSLQKLPNFYLYVDEFQSFANESFADILSEARKYKLNLTIAHQYIEQMSEEVRAAVFGNVGTMITFRVGAFDAEILEKEFAPQFTAEDLVNLGFTQIYLKLMIDGVSSQPFSATTTPPIKEPEVSYRQEVIDSSRAQFAIRRDEIEKNIIDWHSVKEGGNDPRPKKDNQVRPAQSVSRPLPPKREDREIVRPKYTRRPDGPSKFIQKTPDLLEPDDDFVSLKNLKSVITQDNRQTEKGSDKSIYLSSKKTPDANHLADLRAVLQNINSQKRTLAKENDSPKPIADNKIDQSAPKEIAEETLKKILQVDK